MRVIINFYVIFLWCMDVVLFWIIYLISFIVDIGWNINKFCDFYYVIMRLRWWGNKGCSRNFNNVLILYIWYYIVFVIFLMFIRNVLYFGVCVFVLFICLVSVLVKNDFLFIVVKLLWIGIFIVWICLLLVLIEWICFVIMVLVLI